MNVFKQNAIRGLYKTKQDFISDLKKAKSDIKSYDLEFSNIEQNLLTSNTDAYTLYLLGSLFKTLNIDQLNSLFNSYYKVEDQLRFGQYVFQKTNFEYKNSYYIEDKDIAYKTLLSAVLFYNP